MSYDTKTKIALVGTGSFVRETIIPEILRLNNAKLVLIAGSDETETSELADIAKTEKLLVNDFQKILENPQIEIIIIANETVDHSEMVLKALNAGKHVLVAPPLALTLKELKNIEFFYAKKDANNQPYPLLLIMHHYRFSPLIKSLTSFLHKRVGPMIINYQFNAGFIPRDSYKRSQKYGGRNLLEASEIYDLFSALVGTPKVRKAEALSLAKAPEFTDNLDNFFASFSFDDGSIANLVFSSLGNSEYKRDNMTVFCDENIFVFDDFKSLKCFGSLHFEKYSDKNDFGFEAMFRDFIGSVRNPVAPSPVPVQQQLQAARMAIGIEAKLDKPIIPLPELIGSENIQDPISNLKEKALSKFKTLVGKN